MPDAKFKRIAVFCGSSKGKTDAYVECARALGAELVKRQIKLVYGGGNVGCMGAIATTVSAGLGEDSVIGVIPGALQPREISGGAIGELIIVPDMHARKAKMCDLADAFIAMPGGFGTLEEILEMLTWQQLGFHAKPVAFLNWNGFFDHLLAFFDHAVSEGFVRQASRGLALQDSNPASLLDKMQAQVAQPSLLDDIREGKLDKSVRG
ncbi:hypothetical protein WJX73_010267 [Symbiochloris irregularis]|uniref:Cytokinin riboside 5'-monophosphate phosphoribohydrolase n=1 Tax=Symbiochloris irregularis TaxID=706552 RepID=A0AAW1PE03_9CHLO